MFQSSNRHTDVSAEDLSEIWYISLKTAQETLFIRSAILPLSHRYWADFILYTKILTVAWSCDTLDRRTNSPDGDRFLQINNILQRYI